jgi:hypothetical protein
MKDTISDNLAVVNLEKLSAVLTAADDLLKNIRETREMIERNLCTTHNEWKQDLFSDGNMHCEPCFSEYFHANEFEGVHADDRGDL